MGGAQKGGLNILPKKNWHVYNRENRLKVARDEEAQAERQKELDEKNAAAEREHRLKTLKERARQRHGGAANINLDGSDELLTLPEAGAAPPSEFQVPAAAVAALPAINATNPMLALETSVQEHVSKRQRRAEPSGRPPSLADLAKQTIVDVPSIQNNAAIAEAQPPSPPKEPLRHINLFEEEEARAKNPENVAEKRKAQAQRGDIKTQTTDPRFDQSFQLAYGLGGKDAKAPWYAKALLPHEEEEASKAAERARNGGAHAIDAMAEWKRQGAQALVAASEGHDRGGEKELLKGVKVISKRTKERSGSSESSSSESSGDDRKRRRRHRKEKKEGKRKKEKRKKDEKSGQDKWSVLREERLRREEAEKRRQIEAVRSALGGDGPGGRRYYSGYGHGH